MFVKDLEYEVGHGDYCFFNLTIGSTICPIALVCYEDKSGNFDSKRIYIVSRLIRFDGCELLRDFLHIKEYTYVLPVRVKTLGEAIREISHTEEDIRNITMTNTPPSVELEEALLLKFGEDVMRTENEAAESNVSTFTIEGYGDVVDIGNPLRERQTDFRIVKGNVEGDTAVELDCRFNNASGGEIFSHAKSNWFTTVFKSQHVPNRFVTIRTVAMKSEDIKNEAVWDSVLLGLRGKASSWDSDRCGCRVWFDKNKFGELTDEHKAKILLFSMMLSKEFSLKTAICGRKPNVSWHTPSSEYADAVASLSPSVLKFDGVKDKVKEEMKRHFDNSLMEVAIMKDGIVFNGSHGSMLSARICAIVEFCEQVVSYAIMTPWQQLDVDDFKKFLRLRVGNSPLNRYM